MDILRISPQGFCKGVVLAIKKAMEEKGKKNTYCLGSLIHNDIMVSKLKEAGINTIDIKGLTRLEMLELIPPNSTVIISAHGASPKLLEKCKEKGLDIINATCEYVLTTHKEISNHLKDGYDVYYIGTKGHAECEGAIGISDEIKLLSSLDDIDKYEFKDKSFIINQTTMSIYEIIDFHNKIKAKNPNVIIANTICNATTQRQKAVIEARDCDLFIVVGDKKSSNTKKLFNLASNKGKAIMIDSIKDILEYDFKDINKINITSGASTPKEVVDEIIEYLKNRP